MESTSENRNVPNYKPDITIGLVNKAQSSCSFVVKFDSSHILQESTFVPLYFELQVH
jgi:hypothetical protein